MRRSTLPQRYHLLSCVCVSVSGVLFSVGVCVCVCDLLMMIVYPRETPPHIRTARASPQRHTATRTAAPTTADTENTVLIFLPRAPSGTRVGQPSPSGITSCRVCACVSVSGVLFSVGVCVCVREGLRGRARCVAPRASADVASAAWSGRALAVGVKKDLGGLDV